MSYHVTLRDSSGEVIETTGIEKFNQKSIEQKIKELANLAFEGCEIEYWKQDNKFAYIPMLTIVKRNGRFLREVIRFGKVYYRKSLILA